MAVCRLHFVYNVDANPRALVKDFVHRLRDPATYPCRLCDLTYGRFVKKPGWQMFLWSLPVASSFHTRDRFVDKFPSMRHHMFPAVLAEDGEGRLLYFLSTGELNAIISLDALKQEVLSRLKTK